MPEYEGPERRENVHTQTLARIAALDGMVLVHTEQIRAILESMREHTARDDAMLTLITKQLESLKRLVWMALGGLVIVGAISTTVLAHVRIVFG